MDTFKEKFLSSELQPQLFSLVLVTLILIIFSIVIYKKIKKQKVNEAPNGLLLLTEQYVMGVDSLYNEATDGKFSKPGPYIFTLITLLLVSNLVGLVGLDAPSTSYSFTLTLALVSWMGIYVVGIIYHKFQFFKKFLNPTELIGQFAPLISLSFRIFGNMIGGSTILYLIYSLVGWIWGFIPVIGEFNLLGAVVAPVFHVYFDLFDGLIQAFVFSVLTMVYWTVEASTEHAIEDAKIKNKVKKARISKFKKMQRA